MCNTRAGKLSGRLIQIQAAEKRIKRRSVCVLNKLREAQTIKVDTLRPVWVELWKYRCWGYNFQKYQFIRRSGVKQRPRIGSCSIPDYLNRVEGCLEERATIPMHWPNVQRALFKRFCKVIVNGFPTLKTIMHRRFTRTNNFWSR